MQGRLCETSVNNLTNWSYFSPEVLYFFWHDNNGRLFEQIETWGMFFRLCRDFYGIVWNVSSWTKSFPYSYVDDVEFLPYLLSIKFHIQYSVEILYTTDNTYRILRYVAIQWIRVLLMQKTFMHLWEEVA